MASQPAGLFQTSPLRHKDFRRYYYGSVGTALGFTILSTAAAWLMATLIGLRPIAGIPEQPERVRAPLAHGNPYIRGDRVRLKIRGHHRPLWWSSEGDIPSRLR